MRSHFFLLLLSSIFIFSCSKETEEFQGDAAINYVPLRSGKYITYRVDSTVFLDRGTSIAIHSYQEKHQIDSLRTDNLGRPAYRVFRFIRDTAGTGPWSPSGSYYITPLTNTVEVIENNLRFLKLSGPVSETTNWKGNRFLGNDAYGAFYEFSNDDNMSDWEYAYSSTGSTATLRGKTYADVITVDQINESINAPVTNTDAYGYRNYAVEKYAKGLGLIYQELVMWEYQPPSSGRAGYRGFGVKRSILDHN